MQILKQDLLEKINKRKMYFSNKKSVKIISKDYQQKLHKIIKQGNLFILTHFFFFFILLTINLRTIKIRNLRRNQKARKYEKCMRQAEEYIL